MTNRQNHLTPEAAKAKIIRYCVYQERCHQEVRSKLYDIGLRRDAIDEMIAYLITEGFLNEERYAKAFAGGKFRMKWWGRLKIIQALESKGLTARCIQTGLSEIDEDDYKHTLTKLLEKRLALLGGESAIIKRNILVKYAFQKGFESDLVWKSVKDLVPDR